VTQPISRARTRGLLGNGAKTAGKTATNTRCTLRVDRGAFGDAGDFKAEGAVRVDGLETCRPAGHCRAAVAERPAV